MPRNAKRRRSRRLRLNRTPETTAAPKMTTPASRNRAVRTISGGQSAMESLATENAEAQSRQNVATRTGKGSGTRSREGVAGDGTAILAVRMVTVLSCDPGRLVLCHLE